MSKEKSNVYVWPYLKKPKDNKDINSLVEHYVKQLGDHLTATGVEFRDPIMMQYYEFMIMLLHTMYKRNAGIVDDYTEMFEELFNSFNEFDDEDDDGNMNIIFKSDMETD